MGNPARFIVLVATHLDQPLEGGTVGLLHVDPEVRMGVDPFDFSEHAFDRDLLGLIKIHRHGMVGD
jgi:hypothetical protein